MSRRPFLPLDVAFMDDDKIIEAGVPAAWLYLAMLLGCKRFGVDGVLTRNQIDRLGVDKWERSVDKLIQLQLIFDCSEVENDRKVFVIGAWSRWNLLSHEREAVSQSKRDAANSRWHKHAQCITQCSAQCNAPAYAKKRREEKRNTNRQKLSTINESLEEYKQQ